MAEVAARQAVALGVRGARGLALSLPDLLGRGGDGGRFSRRHGQSQEFQEYRDYRVGDDLRHLDWGVLGRSDQLVVRRFHQAVTPHLDLLLDGSRSMAGHRGMKGQAAASMAAFFAACAEHGGFSHKAWQLQRPPRLLGASPQRPGDWPPLEFGDTATSGDVLMRAGGPWRPRGLRLLISDLLWPQTPAGIVQPMHRGAAATVIVQLLEAEELRPTPRGWVRLEDVESGEMLEMMLDDSAVDNYSKALQRHGDAWRAACRRQGVVYVQWVAEEVLEAWRAAAAGRSQPLLRLLQPLLRQRVLQRATGR